jgi:hypothetical protein
VTTLDISILRCTIYTAFFPYITHKEVSMIVCVARLLVCPSCGLHANVAFPDGTESERLYSQEEVAVFVAQAVKDGRLHPAEASYLNEAARSSTLLEVVSEEMSTILRGAERLALKEEGSQPTRH